MTDEPFECLKRRPDYKTAASNVAFCGKTTK